MDDHPTNDGCSGATDGNECNQATFLSSAVTILVGLIRYTLLWK